MFFAVYLAGVAGVAAGGRVFAPLIISCAFEAANPPTSAPVATAPAMNKNVFQFRPIKNFFGERGDSAPFPEVNL